MADTDAIYDPFNTPRDPEEDQDALIMSLRMAQGFILLFAVTNSATERNRRIDSVEAQVPDKKFQHVAVNTETENLLWHLREVLTDPKPDAVFVYGLENWISGAVHPRSIPFLLNLNAARDSFPLLLPAPIVFWIPQYVLRTITDAAPDFFSVRSGVYTFPIHPDEREEMRRALTRMGQTEAMGYSLPERVTRIQELKGMLAEYRSLPKDQRSIQSESFLMNSLAMQLEGEGRYGEAEPLFLEAVAIDRKALPENHPQIATALNNLAGLYELQGRYGEAEPLYLEALAIDRKALPENHPGLATHLNNLAGLYESQGRYGEAEPLYLEAVAIDRKVLPENHPSLATHLNNLAGLYRSQGRYGEAEPLFLEAVAIDRKVLPENHPGLATDLNNLAGLYESQGRYGEAEPLYLEAVAIDRKALPENHPGLATDLNNLAELYRSQGRYGEAEPLFLEALAIDRKALPENHPQIATALNNLAGLYESQGRYGEAEPLYRKAVEIVQASLGNSHPNTMTIVDNYNGFLTHAKSRGGNPDSSAGPL